MAVKDRGIRLTRKVQGLALPALPATKSDVATENQWKELRGK